MGYNTNRFRRCKYYKMKKIKITPSPRSFETVGEAVRFEILFELKNKILDSRIFSADNSLNESQLEYNRACVVATNVIEELMNIKEN